MKVWVGLLFVFAAAHAAEVKPKYGPAGAALATRLSDSQDYVRKNAAPDYWAMVSYYVPQNWGGACSLASVSMVLNAARAHQKLTADDALVTQAKILEKVKEPLVAGKTWAQAVGAVGKMPTGTTLDQLAVLTQKAFEAYGFKVKKVEVIHADGKDPTVKAKIHTALVENEKSTKDFVLANFNQQAYTADADAGHIAPVAAFDAASRRVLVFDPDRDYYEPYWVSEDTFVAGMATLDKTAGKNRGLVWISVE